VRNDRSFFSSLLLLLLLLQMQMQSAD